MMGGGMWRRGITIWTSSVIQISILRESKVVGLFLLLSCCSWFGQSVSLAADAGKLIEKDGKYVFVESMDPATKLPLKNATAPTMPAL